MSIEDITPEYRFFQKQDEAMDFFKKGDFNDTEKYFAMEWLQGAWYNRAKAVFNEETGETYVFPFNNLIYGLTRPIYSLSRKFPNRITDSIRSKIDKLMVCEFSIVFNHEYLHQILKETMGDEYQTIKTGSFINDIESLVNYLNDYALCENGFTEPITRLES